MATPTPTSMNSSSGSKLSDTLLPSLKGLQRNRLIRRSFLAWVRELGLRPAKHHRVLIQALQEVAEGKIDRLMVFMPPGSAKSTYTSILFVPWFLAYHLNRTGAGGSDTPRLTSGPSTTSRQAALDRARNVLAASHTAE